MKKKIKILLVVLSLTLGFTTKDMTQCSANLMTNSSFVYHGSSLATNIAIP